MSFDRLTVEEQEAVLAEDKRVLILAGAASGILAITFTRNAAKESEAKHYLIKI